MIIFISVPAGFSIKIRVVVEFGIGGILKDAGSYRAM
jgi:hypothetical protein